MDQQSIRAQQLWVMCFKCWLCPWSARDWLCAYSSTPCREPDHCFIYLIFCGLSFINCSVTAFIINNNYIFKRCKRRWTIGATSGRLQGLWDVFTYGDSMLFLKCVTDKGGSERKNTFNLAFSIAYWPKFKSDAWIEYKWMSLQIIKDVG